MSADQRLADLGLTLPSPPKPIGNYVPFRLAGNLLFLSGVGPRRADETMITGKVGADLTVEQGYEAAKLCGAEPAGQHDRRGRHAGACGYGPEGAWHGERRAGFHPASRR